MIIYFMISMLGSSLLFLVQPMAAKVALPILGGSPFVWNSCMVFFQALLLAGYLYAHLLNRSVPVKRQPFIHLPLLALALFAFPLSFTGSLAIDPALQPMLWLFSMLAMSVGLPFFVLCATSPLSQRWFAAYAPTRQPYVLYAASNLGSFAGLLAYPALVEPLLPIHSQADVLFYGFLLLLTLFAVAALQLYKTPASVSASVLAQSTADIPRQRILTWIILAFVPSSLLYGVTSYITTDIASVPLFWVVPLALYLLTFVLVFGRSSPSLDVWRTLQRMGAPAMALLALLPLTYPVPTMALHLAIFFAVAMMCHSRLYALKPSPQQLTSFFLWVSFGGVLGGVFNSFVAPFVFTTVIEYPLMLILSVLVVGWKVGDALPTKDELLKLAIVWLIFALMFYALGSHAGSLQVMGIIAKPVRIASLLLSGIILFMAAYFMHKERALLHVLWLLPALLLLTPLFNRVVNDEVAFTGRNVFGVSRVMWQAERDAWVFRHGTTYHGVQSADEALRLKPTSYYGTPLVDIYGILPKHLTHAPIGVMGMGVGTVACYGHPHQHYDFFEIDPLVDKIAHDTRYFTFLSECPPEKNIIMGDGRVGISRIADKHYGLIIIDVFSSDAIPMHILTREAVAMYVNKLQQGGLIAFNISNRHIDLVPVLSAIAKDNGMAGVWRVTLKTSSKLEMSSEWVVLAKDAASLAPLMRDNQWNALPTADDQFLWRDDYSNILRSIRF